MGLNYIKQLISCEDMTSQTDNNLGNLCRDYHCSIVLHTFSKIHYFLISYPILLKLFLIGLSDFSAFIESKLFFEWTCPLNVESRCDRVNSCLGHICFTGRIRRPYAPKIERNVRRPQRICGGLRVTLGRIPFFTGRTGRRVIITRSYNFFHF